MTQKGAEPGRRVINADEMARNHAGPEVGTPGKTTRVAVGDSWIDSGAHCDGQTGEGCLLADDQRLRLIIDLKDRIGTAATNYKLALTQLRVEELIKKEEDLHWVLSLALEVAGGQVLALMKKAVTGLKAAGVASLQARAGKRMAGEYLSDRSWVTRAETALSKLNTASADGLVKAGFEPIKRATNQGAKTNRNLDDTTAKQFEHLVHRSARRRMRRAVPAVRVARLGSSR